MSKQRSTKTRKAHDKPLSQGNTREEGVALHGAVEQSVGGSGGGAQWLGDRRTAPLCGDRLARFGTRGRAVQGVRASRAGDPRGVALAEAGARQGAGVPSRSCRGVSARVGGRSCRGRSAIWHSHAVSLHCPPMGGQCAAATCFCAARFFASCASTSFTVASSTGELRPRCRATSCTSRSTRSM